MSIMTSRLASTTRPIYAVLTVVVMACVTAPALGQNRDEPITAVLGAMPIEVEPLLQELAHPDLRTIQGIPFTVGTLNGRDVVIAETGVGKVNAAITTTLLIEHFDPSEVLFTGIAGALAPNLAPGDVMIGQRAAQHDLGTLGADGLTLWGARPAADTTRNPVFFPSDTTLLELAARAAEHVQLNRVRPVQRPPRIVVGTVLTGDVFVANSEKKKQLAAEFEGDAIEMEGAAVAQVCWQMGRTPLILIRGISDAADEAAYETAEVYQRIAVDNAARLTGAVIAALNGTSRR